MSRRLVSLLLVGAGIGVLVLAYLLPPRTDHPVTPFMQSAAEEASGKPITKLATDGGRPTVVVFVLPDCPCSIEFEPFVQQLHRAYGDRASFVEIVGGDGPSAEQWKKEQGTPFSVVGDPDRAIANEFGAKRSAYTALVVRGRIVKLWPGYSAEMLRELGGLISAETKEPPQSFDFDRAPKELRSGCAL